MQTTPMSHSELEHTRAMKTLPVERVYAAVDAAAAAAAVSNWLDTHVRGQAVLHLQQSVQQSCR